MLQHGHENTFEKKNEKTCVPRALGSSGSPVTGPGTQTRSGPELEIAAASSSLVCGRGSPRATLGGVSLPRRPPSAVRPRSGRARPPRGPRGKLRSAVAGAKRTPCAGATGGGARWGGEETGSVASRARVPARTSTQEAPAQPRAASGLSILHPGLLPGLHRSPQSLGNARGPEGRAAPGDVRHPNP
jgi:hypothetical protein